jgi:hypothetical protein
MGGSMNSQEKLRWADSNIKQLEFNAFTDLWEARARTGAKPIGTGATLSQAIDGAFKAFAKRGKVGWL